MCLESWYLRGRSREQDVKEAFLLAIIDSHQHFWDPRTTEFPEFPGEAQVLNRPFLPEDLAGAMRKTGVDYTVLVQALPQKREMNEWYFDIADDCGFVAGVVAWVDLLRPREIPKALDALQKESRFVGVRHVVELEPDVDWLVHSSVVESLRELAKRDIPFDLCIKPRHLEIVLRLLEEVNGLRLVIDHMAKPDIAAGGSVGWHRNLAKIASNPRVHCKLSGLVTEADWKNWSAGNLVPYVRYVIDLFGYERIMFGSDWPVCLLAADYQQVWDLANELLDGIADEQRELVFGANAARFYGLSV